MVWTDGKKGIRHASHSQMSAAAACSVCLRFSVATCCSVCWLAVPLMSHHLHSVAASVTWI